MIAEIANKLTVAQLASQPPSCSSRKGAKVIITASSPDSHKKAKTELAGSGLDIVQCDVSVLKQLDALYAYIKKEYPQGVDVVFANAGVFTPKPTADVDEVFYDWMMDINVKGVYFTVQKALLVLNKGSSVIINASAVSTKGFPGFSVYSATKAAVRKFARTRTAEIPPSQTRFNVLSPGYTITPIFGKVGVTQEAQDGAAQTVPMKRFGTAEEIASAALFLASSDSSYMAGADLVVDGGIAQI